MASMFDRVRLALKRAATFITMTEPWERVPRWFEHDFTNLVEEGYQKSELVFACCQIIANCASESTLQVYAGDEVQEGHPLRALIEHPCPELKMAEFDFWELTLITMHLAGVAYWEKERAARGNVVALWPLRPDTVKVVPGVRGIDHYVVGDAELVVPAADMLRFSFPDPLSPFDSQSPLEVAARQVNVDLDLQAYIKLLFQNNTVPQGILSTEQYLAPTEADSLKQAWEVRQGGDRRGSISVLGKGATYQEIGSRLENIDSTNLHQLSETRVCMALGVPPLLIGALAGLEKATYSNFEQAEVQFWHSKILPLWKKLSDQVTEELAPDFGAGLRCDWDLSEVWALEKEAQAKRAWWLSCAQAGMATVNEFRVEAGMEPLAAGEVLLWPSSSTPQIAAKAYEKPEPPPQLVVQPPGAEGEEAEPPTETAPEKAQRKELIDIFAPADDQYAEEAQEWDLTPAWMQTVAQNIGRTVDETMRALWQRSVDNILAITDDEWQAAEQGKSLQPPNGERV